MGVKGCPKCLKVTLILINSLVMIAGATAIGLGAWLMTSKYGPDKLKDMSFNGYQHALSITIIVGGCVILLLSFLGCCGAISENRCALGTFGASMVLLVILFIAAVAVAFVFKKDLRKQFSNELEDALLRKYETSDKEKGWTNLWDFLQTELKCCGVEGDGGGKRSFLLWRDSNWWKNNIGHKGDTTVPKSCCDPKLFVDTCQRAPDTPIIPPMEIKTGLYTTGCVDKLVEQIKKYIAIIGGVGAAILVIILLSAVFSFIVCASIDTPNAVV